MMRGAAFRSLLAVFWCGLNAAAQTAGTPAAPAAPAPPISPLSATLPPAEVIAHLEKAIAWYRHVEAAGQSGNASVDILLRDSMHQNALQALQLAFSFARAEAAFRASLRQVQAAGANPSEAPAAARNLDDTAARAADRIARLQSQITALDSSIAASSGGNRALLSDRRQELQSELELAQEIQKTVQSMVNFAGANTASSKSATSSFTGQINELQQTVPEARAMPAVTRAAGAKEGAPAPSKTPSAAMPNPSASAHSESQGFFGLAGTVFSASRDRGQIQTLIKETDALAADIGTLKDPLVTQLRSSIKQSEDIAAAATSQTADQLGAGQKQITGLTTQFRQLSVVVVPLGEEQIMVQAIRGSLVEWRNLLTEQYESALRYLLVRLGALGLAIVVLLVGSELWKRATFRYVRDVRRRRQFLVIRRIVVTVLFLLIFVVGFATQFGSVATYAGFLTAGLAVALQNVILAVIAYFFLIGRYGVRVGDRVTIGGVTGDVIELGLVRIYLMELSGPAGDLHSTGRVVLFANSILFQPQALFKQLPGTNYVWHSITVGLAPESDMHLVEERLKQAVERVFTNYRPDLEHQHAVLERSVEIEVPAPTPECRFNFTGTALQFRVRYPVELKKESDADAELLRAISNAIAAEPKLVVVPSGSPKLEASV